MTTPPDLSRTRRVHIVAVGGAGMSAIATILVQQGHHVSGSDRVGSVTLERLRAMGVDVKVGHDPRNLRDTELVVISTAVPADNPEVLAAERLGLPVLRRIDLLPAFARLQPFVSVSGTHGKTTTTSMLATAMVGAGVDPSFLIGAQVGSLGAAAAAGSGPWFVIEADESDGSFLAGQRAAAVVTNVEPDHLEFWGGWDQLRDGFSSFLRDTDGPRLVCADDPEAAAIGRRVGARTYGCHPAAHHRIEELELSARGSTFGLTHGGRTVRVELPVPGLHNALDAAGALAIATELGVDPVAAAEALRSFSGAARRFERRGSVGGIEFVDDYAHLPTEVRAAIAAGRSGGYERVVAVFQPHRYSRTEALWADFASAFDDADVVVLTEIYGAGEAPRPGVTGALLVEAVRTARPEARVIWCADRIDLVAVLADELRPGDLCMTIGAGDVTDVADLVIGSLAGDRPTGPGAGEP